MLSFFHKLHWNEKLKAHSILLENIDIQKVNYILKLHVWFQRPTCQNMIEWNVVGFQVKWCPTVFPFIPFSKLTRQVPLSHLPNGNPTLNQHLNCWKALAHCGTVTIISSHTIWNNKLLNKLASLLDAIVISNLKLLMTHSLTLQKRPLSILCCSGH